jgi:hypothetical protein
MFIPWLDIEVSSYADFLWHVKAYVYLDAPLDGLGLPVLY